MSSQDDAKRTAARAALAFVPERGVIGLGSGSTAKYFIDAVGELVAQGRSLRAIATSDQSRAQALALGIPLADEEVVWDIALTVDGADEVSEHLDLIKGGGAAHTREKIVSNASRKNVIVVDDSKLSSRLGEKWPVPIEILPFGSATTMHLLSRFGTVSVRKKEGVTLRTDSNNLVVDVSCGPIENPSSLDTELRAIPGVVETGLFCGRADVVLVAGADGIRTLNR